MRQTLTDIARQLKDTGKKVQLIYAINGMGKTRLSREFKTLIDPRDDDENDAESPRHKLLYYNAFTEDLFYWDNDLSGETGPMLKIQRNAFTDWVLKDQGQDQNIITTFQRYASHALTPRFDAGFTEVTFSLERGDDEQSGDLKISKGEERNFIWSIFHTLLDQVISVLNVAESDDRDTDQFDQLEYVFVDDPETSLDENPLIELTVNLSALVSSSHPGLKLITAHA